MSKQPDLWRSFMLMMWAMYFCRVVDDPSLWHCDCGNIGVHVVEAGQCLSACLDGMVLEAQQ